MGNRIGRNEKTVEKTTVETTLEKVTDKTDDRANVRTASDNITDMLDEQAIKNFEINLELNRYRSELRHALEKLDEHSYCPGAVPVNCNDTSSKSHNSANGKPEEGAVKESVHGEDCHCSKCCPNPNPNFFQKHKVGLLIGILWVILVVLAIGLAPTGSVADAINTSWVELIVNFFKMALFAIAGIATYNLIKKPNE